MTRITYQVEYTSRPDEREHVVPYDSRYNAACAFARRMSDQHDCSAYVVAMEPMEDGGTTTAVGHVVYTFGVRGEIDGVVK